MIEQTEPLSQAEADAAIDEALRDTADVKAARCRVRRFHFARYREDAPAPVKATHPGPLDPQPLPVTPSPSSHLQRYGNSPACGRNSKARKGAAA